MQFYVSLCICSCAMNRFFFALCDSTHFMEIIAALVCAITALLTTLLAIFQIICKSIINYSFCRMFHHQYERYLKGCYKVIRCLAFFCQLLGTHDDQEFSSACNNLLMFWLEHSFYSFCKFKGGWILLILFSFTVWVEIFNFSPLETFFLLCWYALKYSAWLVQYFPRNPSSLSCLGG